MFVDDDRVMKEVMNNDDCINLQRDIDTTDEI